MLLKLGSKYNNNGGIQALKFTHGLQRHVPISTSKSLSTSLPEAPDPFANYLVTSLGFSKFVSLSISVKLSRFRLSSRANKANFNFDTKAKSVIEFLKQQGFDQSHISKVVSYHPRILFTEVDKTLKPKIKLLKDLGFSGSDLVRVISSNPVFLKRRFGPAIKALRQVLCSDENVVKVIKAPGVKSCYAKYLIPNVALLEDCYGISLDSIRQHMLQNPRTFLLKTELLRDVLSRTENKLGIPRQDSMFLYGVRFLTSYREETIESKFRPFKDFGWTDSDIMVLFRQNPCALMSSSVRIKKCLEALMNDMGYEPGYLARHNCLFTCSTEKRVVPRHKILVILKDKGLIRTDFPLDNAIILTDSMFLKKFVLPFQEVHEVYAKLTGHSVKLLGQGASI